MKLKVVENTVVKKGKEVIVKGNPVDHSLKHNTLSSTGVIENRRIVGANIGTTINMGDYESLRIDCWLTDFVGEKESYPEAFKRIFDIVTSEVESLAKQLK